MSIPIIPPPSTPWRRLKAAIRRRVREWLTYDDRDHQVPTEYTSRP